MAQIASRDASTSAWGSEGVERHQLGQPCCINTPFTAENFKNRHSCNQQHRKSHLKKKRQTSFTGFCLSFELRLGQRDEKTKLSKYLVHTAYHLRAPIKHVQVCGTVIKVTENTDWEHLHRLYFDIVYALGGMNCCGI